MLKMIPTQLQVLGLNSNLINVSYALVIQLNSLYMCLMSPSLKPGGLYVKTGYSAVASAELGATSPM